MVKKRNVVKRNVIIITFIIIFSLTVIVSTVLAASTHSTVVKNNLGKGSFKVHSDVNTKMAEDGLVDVIIMFDNTSDSSSTQNVDMTNTRIKTKSNTQISSTAKTTRDSMMSRVKGFNKKHDLNIINGYSGTLTSQGLEDLKKQAQANGVNIRVFENKPNYLHEDFSYDNSLQSTLALSTAAVGANYSWNTLNITGRGVIIALVDGGIDYTHPDFGSCTLDSILANNCSKVVGGYNFVDNNNDPIDVYGHGTHVAGIMAANGSIVKGVAPEARILAVKVCGSGSSCLDDGDIINAMQWAATQNASIMSLSLGRYASDWDIGGNNGKDPFSTAVDNFVAQGIIIVVSAGNDGPGVSTINTPAAAERAITVGAENDYNTTTISDDIMWNGSSRGPSAFGRLDPELVAPGVSITSTYLKDIFGGYISLTGTSMAAPFVSGAAALLLEQNPSLTPSQVRSILMQSAGNINDKVFKKGAGVLDVKNALTDNVYAIINSTNPYQENVVNDRWEFVVTPYSTNYATITIINTNNYNITLHSLVESITNLETDDILNITQVGIPASINVSNNSNYSFSINFTLKNLSSTYATTYGGIIFLNGTGNNGTANLSKTLRIPIVITIPVTSENRYLSRQMTNGPYSPIDGTYTHEDVYYYCYYDAHPKNINVSINWTLGSDDLDLYLYNSTGDLIALDHDGSKVDTVSTLQAGAFNWFRIDGWSYTPPVIFNINITADNHPPVFQGILAIGGILNDTNTVLFYRPSNLTFNISYSDIDGDAVVVSINDSGYILVNQSQNNSEGYAVFSKLYSSNLSRDSTVLLTFTDSYGAQTTQVITVLLRSSIIIDDYYPSTATPVYIHQNNTLNFRLDAHDMNNNSLNYTWYVNHTVVASTQNYSFDAKIYNASSSNVSVLIQNNASINQSNETLSWTVFIDGTAPIITIQNPTPSAVYTKSKISINYTVSDLPAYSSSGVDSCWYVINGTGISGGINYTINTPNITLVSCSNTSIYLINGNYTLKIYSNDTTGNVGYSNVTFEVADTTPPNITGESPGGPIAYTTSVTLSVNTDENATCRYASSDISYNSMTGIFSDSVLQHTAAYSVSSDEIVTLYVRCSDMSNNMNNDSIVIYFTVGSKPPDGGGSGGSGSGGSGSNGGGNSGGGSGIGGYDPHPESITKTYDALREGITNITISKSDLPVSQVTLNSSMNLTNVTITISRTDTPEKNYTLDDVYAYILVSQENIPENALSSADIYFSVGQGWLKENNLTKEEVVLLAYFKINDTWNMLSTEYLNEDDYNIYYISKSSGPGLYAIGINRTQAHGNPVIEPPEPNKTKNVSAVPQLNSDATNSGNSGGSSGSSNIVNNLVNSIAKQKDLLWILSALISTFLVVVVSLVILKKAATKHYENELILATNQEFKQAEKVITKEEPNVADIVRKELSKMVGDKISEAKKQDARSQELRSKDVNSGIRTTPATPIAPVPSKDNSAILKKGVIKK